MQDVQPLSAYENAAAPSFWRSTLVLGLLWGIPMTMFMLRTNQGDLWFVLALGAVGALIFGTLVTTLVHFARRQLTQQVYYCMFPIVPAAPPGEYDARLMCSLIRGSLAIGGHLYLGTGGWTFTPHARNGPFYRTPVRWNQPARLSLSTQPMRVGWIAWLFGFPRRDHLVVADGNARALFVVPNASDVASALSAYR